MPGAGAGTEKKLKKQGKGGAPRSSKSDPNAVQGTNDQSIVSKRSSARCGYFQDDFLGHFVIKAARRSPLINRFYYLRLTVIDALLSRFIAAPLKTGPKRQVITLGAGFDSMFFRLAKRNGPGITSTRFTEIDFPDTVTRKRACIATNDSMRGMVGGSWEEATKDVGVLGSTYSLVGADLTQMKQVEAAFAAAGVDFSVPTVFVSEAVMTYIDAKHSTPLCKWIADKFDSAGFVLYEQCLPTWAADTSQCDAFGTQMLRHFESMGSPLRAVHKLPHLNAQRDRMISSGWMTVDGIDLLEYYRSCISDGEKARITALEPFDEEEEWRCTGQHYVIQWSVVDRNAIGIPTSVHVHWTGDDKEGDVPADVVIEAMRGRIDGVAIEARHKQTVQDASSNVVQLSDTAGCPTVTVGWPDITEGGSARTDGVSASDGAGGLGNDDCASRPAADSSPNESHAGVRWGHTAVVVERAGVVLIYGGVGGEQRQRLSDMHVLRCTDYKWVPVVLQAGTAAPPSRVHHTMVLLSCSGPSADGSFEMQVLVHGGRASPARAYSDAHVATVSFSGNEATVTWTKARAGAVLGCGLEGDIGRFRHVASPWRNAGSGSAALIGLGRLGDGSATNDWLVMEPNEPNWSCEPLVVTNDGPCGRHSAACLSLRSDNSAIAVHGGLCDDGRVLFDLWILSSLPQSSTTSLATSASSSIAWSWSNIDVSPVPIASRFSHALVHISNADSDRDYDTLAIVGGCGVGGCVPPSTFITTMHLNTVTPSKPIQATALITSPPSSAMVRQLWLQKGTAVSVRAPSGADHSSKLLILGGGGNFGVFGSHNNAPVTAVSVTVTQ